MDIAPKVTIITPSYNQGKYIEETILSIINQDYPNLEYVIIDGGSTDNTVDIIKKYESRITYWVSEKDKGQTDAINKGLQIATGDIINWINSDDQLAPRVLHKVADYFLKHPDIAIVHGRIEYFGEQTASYYSRNVPAKDISTRYAAHICMPQPATFFHRRIIDELGLLDSSLHFSMDTDLYVKAALHYPFLQVEDIFARFRLHPESKSVSAFRKRFLEDNAKIFSKVLATLNDKDAIHLFKKTGLYQPPSVLYSTASKPKNAHRLIFYFLQHRLYTLYFNGEKKEFKRLFRFLLWHYTYKTLGSVKLIAYRIFLFLPSGFFHSLSKKRDNAA